MTLSGKTRFDCAGFGLLLAMASTAMAGDWPAFRGPGGNGLALEDKVPLHWEPGKNVRWKTALPGPGNSSPIVSRGRVFVTCAQDTGTRRNLYCFDRWNGRQVWVRTVEFPGVEPTHRSNPYCASTPVADGERVVVWHGSAGVYCYNFDGQELWKKDLGAMRHDWGYASSPIIHRGKVILNFGPGARTFLAALDLKTGNLLWTERLEGGESWGSVVLAAGRLYVTSRRGVTSVFRPDPEKFELLAMNDLGEPRHATPAISDGDIFLRTDLHLYCIADE